MKNYLKYDFTAIIGAEVNIVLKNRHKWGGTLKLIDEESKSIFLCPNDNLRKANWFAIEDIVPGSLSAKIKVEDMSVKQLKRLTEEEKDYFGEDEDVSIVIFMKEKTLHYDNGKHVLYRGRRFDGYIDCTDWGWKE